MKNQAPFRSLFVAISLLFLVSCNFKSSQDKNTDLALAETQSTTQTETDPNKDLLIGEWSASGTPKVIKIANALDNGKLDIKYFDPKDINISKASWLKTGTHLSILIELEDINYPLSSFKLNYLPDRDVLNGDFFDVAQNSTFPVEFVRIQ